MNQLFWHSLSRVGLPLECHRCVDGGDGRSGLVGERYRLAQTSFRRTL